LAAAQGDQHQQQGEDAGGHHEEDLAQAGTVRFMVVTMSIGRCVGGLLVV
jgi:hypothetical protein